MSIYFFLNVHLKFLNFLHSKFELARYNNTVYSEAKRRINVVL